MKKRIEILKDRISSQNPDKHWVCKDHNAMGTEGTVRFCCEVELEKLTKQDYIKKEDVKNLIIKEIAICREEGTPTSRLTSLFNKL